MLAIVTVVPLVRGMLVRSDNPIVHFDCLRHRVDCSTDGCCDIRYNRRELPVQRTDEGASKHPDRELSDITIQTNGELPPTVIYEKSRGEPRLVVCARVNIRRNRSGGTLSTRKENGYE